MDSFEAKLSPDWSLILILWSSIGSKTKSDVNLSFEIEGDCAGSAVLSIYICES